MTELQDLQRMSNAAIKKARQAAALPEGLDDILSLFNARLRRLESSAPLAQKPSGSERET